MPELIQGNIFEILRERQLAIIFGHIGFDQMGASWRAFQDVEQEVAQIRDPFTERPNDPLQLLSGPWLWFVPAQENQGMTEAELTAVLDRAFAWAREKGLSSVITNGISDIDHGRDTDRNRNSDDQRAQFLIHYSQEQERDGSVRITLISLNDIFVRNAPKEKDWVRSIVGTIQKATDWLKERLKAALDRYLNRGSFRRFPWLQRSNSSPQQPFICIG